MKRTPDIDKTALGRLRLAIAELESVRDELEFGFTVEHLTAAEFWSDRFECLKWAIESGATVAEMTAWHRARNGMDLFSESEQ